MKVKLASIIIPLLEDKLTCQLKTYVYKYFWHWRNTHTKSTTFWQCCRKWLVFGINRSFFKRFPNFLHPKIKVSSELEGVCIHHQSYLWVFHNLDVSGQKYGHNFEGWAGKELTDGCRFNFDCEGAKLLAHCWVYSYKRPCPCSDILVILENELRMSCQIFC